ncbi:hypothetical protein [Bradyrhizobium sp.]|uniref:hypothetical protein n=1 Tax=Bradyrhizobium sp. TaxID=376 RepID=UPI003C5EFDAE
MTAMPAQHQHADHRRVIIMPGRVERDRFSEPARRSGTIGNAGFEPEHFQRIADIDSFLSSSSQSTRSYCLTRVVLPVMVEPANTA